MVKNMTIEDFIMAMKILLVSYRETMTDDEIKTWYTYFEDVNFMDFRSAIKRIVQKNKYMPSIAELRAEITTITNPELQLDVDDEWNKVRYCIRHFGPYKEEEAMEYLNPMTREIVQTMDYQRLNETSTEEMIYEYKRFKDMFNSYRKTTVNALGLNDEFRTLIENKRMKMLDIDGIERIMLDYEI